MKNIHKPALNAAFLFALLGVIMGAMGAHALKQVLNNDLLEAYETAIRYQFYHSFALALAGILYAWFSNAWIKRAVWCFITGTILFSGSIYLLVALKSTTDKDLGALGILTPIGGLVLIAGWICMLAAINYRKATK